MSRPSETQFGEKAEPSVAADSRSKIPLVAGIVALAVIAITGYPRWIAASPAKQTKTTSAQGSGFVDLVGGVKAPQRIVYVPGLTVESAIRQAGGLTYYADGKKVTLMRSGTASVINFRSLQRHPLRDVLLEPGDKLFVPEILW